MSLLKKTIFNVDIFRIICLIISIFLIIPYFYNYVGYLKFLHIYAFLIVIFDLVGERRLLQNKIKFFSYLLCLSYSFTMVLNRELFSVSHISDLGYFLVQVILLTSYNSKKDDNNLFHILTYIYIIAITLLNVVAIVMFINQYQLYINESFIGMYPHEYRLCGMFGNPAVLSFVTVIAIGFILIAGTYKCKHLYIKNGCLIVCMLINYFVLILANARTAILALFVMLIIFTFLISKKSRKVYQAIILSLLVLMLNFMFYNVNKKIGSHIVSSYLSREITSIDKSDEKPNNEESNSNKEVEIQKPEEDEGTKQETILEREDTGLNGRADLWKSGFHLMKNSPFFGIGLNNVNYKLQNLTNSHIEVSGSLHNSYLEFAVAFGACGILIVLLIVVSMIDNTHRYFKKCKDDKYYDTAIGILSLICCLLVIGIADSSLLFSMYPTSIVFCSLIGYLYFIYDKAFESNNILHETFLWAWLKKKLHLSQNFHDVCFVIDSLGGGGAEKILTNIVAALSDTHKVTILTLWSEEILEKQVDARIVLESIDHFSLKLLKRAFYWINRHYLPVRLINYLYLNYKYKYYVAFLEGLSTKLISEVKGENMKKYTWVHIDMEKENWVLKYFKTLEQQKLSYERFDQIFCVSNEVKDSFVKIFGCEDKAIVQLNLVDTRNIKELAKENVVDFKFDEKYFYLYSIGRLNHQKGYDRLIRIMKKLIDEGYLVKTLIIGEGDLRIELENLIQKYKLTESIYLLGFQNNPYKYAKYCDLFVCSSRAEGYSTVITENLVMGKAIISTKCAGVVEQLGQSEYGIVVENDDTKLYEGIKSFLDNQDKIPYYEQKAYERGNKFEYHQLKKEYEEIFS